MSVSDSPDEWEEAVANPSPATGNCLIVGLGVSSAGNHSLTTFFKALTDQPGAAFVIVETPDPDHKKIQPDFFASCTQMPIVQVQKRTFVEPDTIYIAPPDKLLLLEDGHLEVRPDSVDHVHFMPMDAFFQSLANEQKERAICAVFAGVGTDGSLGLKAVKAQGGLTLVQSPATAEKEQLPLSAIASGDIDRVVSPEEMARIITHYCRHPYTLTATPASVNKNDDTYASILSLLHARTGHQFNCYKNSTLNRRIHRRISLHQLASMEEYLQVLRNNAEEVDELFRDLLIGVTSFFREPTAWELLKNEVLPEMIAQSAGNGKLRVWVAGCATGEEAYTTAMVFTEVIAQAKKDIQLTIFATDIDRDAFKRARTGIYPINIANHVSSQRLNRFFNRFDEHHYEVKKELREKVVFAPQSLIQDPPFSHLDMIICRNVLIYLDNEVQRKIIKLFHFALRSSGLLFLGTSETVGAKADHFASISKKWRIYRKVGAARPGAVSMPIVSGAFHKNIMQPLPINMTTRRDSPQSIAHESLANFFAPAGVLINHNMDILYIHGSHQDFLQLPQGEPTTNLLDQVRSGLRQKLRNLLGRAIKSNQPVETDDARVKFEDGSYRPVKITVIPVRHRRESESLLLVTFESSMPVQGEKPAKVASESDASELSQLEYELQATREELQSTIEELETSNEELKSSNQEVMSMNEELQSTNEELETSKEELQSLNEELATVNNELNEKILELEHTNDDLGNLLASTNIATLFLDRDLNVKRFTPATTELMHLMPTDVGRPITHIAHRFQDAQLIDDARRVLQNLIPHQKEILSDDQRWFVRKILPYRTNDDRIGGLVLTFVDVTTQKRAEQALRDSEKHVRRIIDNQLAFVAVLDPDGTLTDVNQPALVKGGIGREDVVGKKFWDCYWCAHDPQVQQRIKADLEQASRGNITRRDEIFRVSNDERLFVDFMVSPVYDHEGNIICLIPSGVDVSERKKAEQELAAREAQFKLAIEESPLPAMLYAEDGEIMLLSKAWTAITGYTQEDIPTVENWMKNAYPDRMDVMKSMVRNLFEKEVRLQNHELEIRCKDGRQRFWRFSSSPLGRTSDGRRLRITKAMDVTELRETYVRMEELNRTLEHKVIDRTRELEQTMRRLRHLAHELTQTEQRERRRLASTVHDNLQQLIAAARIRIGRLDHLPPDEAQPIIEQVKEVLDEAAQACRNLTTELAPTVLYDAGLMAALRWLSEWMRKRYDLQVTCHIIDEVQASAQDMEVLLFQSVRELLFNIVKHANTNQATLTVDQPEHGWLRIVIADNGCGFDPDKTLADETKDKGFGLFSIRERVAVMGGRIEIDSDPTGTRTTLIAPAQLPLGKSALMNSSQSSSSRQIAKPAEGEPVRILLVDDHEMIRKGLAQLLMDQEDFELVGEAANGVEAIELAHQCQPHVVIMDVNMPRMNGIEATRQLMCEMPGLCVIGLSVQTDEGTISAMTEAGALGLVPKGGPPEELWQYIRHCIVAG